MDMKKFLADGLKEKVPGISPDQLTKSLTDANLEKMMNVGKNALNDKITSLQSSAASVLSANSALDVAKSFPDPQSIFNNILNTDATALNSIKSDIDNVKKEVQSKIKTLASDSAEAIAKPVSFVTKPVTDTIKGADTNPLGNIQDNLLGSGLTDSLANLSKVTNTPINSIGDATSSITNVANSFTNNIHNSIGDFSGGITGAIGNTIGGIDNALMGSITGTLDTIKDITGIDKIVSAGRELTNSALSVLPGPLAEYISAGSHNFINDTMHELLGDKLGSVNYILEHLSGLGADASIIDKVLNLGNGSIYSALTNGGRPVDSIFGNNSSSFVMALYRAAQLLCGDIVIPDALTDYRHNKDLHDVLIQIATDAGLKDLVEQLKKCKEEETSYFDDRTVTVLQNRLPDVSYRGDTNMYKTVQEVLGPSYVSNSENDIMKLIANMKDDKTNIDNVKAIMKSAKVSTDDLIKTKTYLGDDVEVYSGKKVVVLTASGTGFVDGATGSDTRKLIQGLFAL